MKPTTRIPMQHPIKRDQYGKPVIQHLNPQTVRSGKAAKMGYLPIPKPEKAPDFKQPKQAKIQD